ncbi:MAG TPA: hypothetical protein ENN84_08960, partial [Candidatus Marinimicrobia bacterium]|nr:hypothetical protein [Candidatus Neomarinimicrobiota bacterium]
MAEASSLPEYSLYPILEPDRALTSINAIVQDSTGFLWFASQHGLHRYDGKSYKSYYSDSLSTTLLNAHFLTAHYDFKGRIWLGTLHGGFHLFDPLYETFFPFIIPSSNPKDNTISYFANAPSDSFLYILTGGHKIYRFNLNSLRLDNSDALDFINHSADIKKIYAIYLWDANTIWLGVDENRLVKFNLKNKTKRIYSLPDSPRLQPGRIRHITKNRFRRLLITYNKKALYDFNPETGFFNLIYPVGDSRDHINESFLRSFEDQYGNYWLSASKDLIHIDPTSYHSRVYNVYFPDANPMESNNRYPLFEDRQGILWTTTNKGVHRLIRKSPVYYHLDTKDSEFQKNNNNIIATLAADYKNQIWLGGQSGLYRIEKNRKELINVDLSEKWSSSRIYKLLEHPAGTLWIAGNNFLGNIDVNTGNIKSLFDSTGFR